MKPSYIEPPKGLIRLIWTNGSKLVALHMWFNWFLTDLERLLVPRWLRRKLIARKLLLQPKETRHILAYGKRSWYWRRR